MNRAGVVDGMPRLALFVLAVALAGCASKSGSSGSTAELKTASDLTSTDKRANIRLQLAVGYYQGGNYEVALDEIKQALMADPELSDAYSVRALIYTAMGETALAEENYQRAMRLAPGNADLNNNYGSFLCQTGRFAPAMAQFDIALKNPKYASPVKAMANAGGCALKMKQYDVAERYFTSALRLDPDFPTVQAGLARVAYQRRDYARAGFYLNMLKAQTKPEAMSADVLWLAIRIERKLGEADNVTSLGTQLRRRHASSPEFAAFQRGAFDE
ncbi:type IV pilus biogenesis/stability protein PilW [Massilia sp. TWP1-3-3]|uniref:type IV pilus biogenesis/stability protein PilW n=1 Tax=Massilia sp. TWP1-3-3 TaxID=2804573 RepID=UPI003CEB49FF